MRGGSTTPRGRGQRNVVDSVARTRNWTRAHADRSWAYLGACDGQVAGALVVLGPIQQGAGPDASGAVPGGLMTKLAARELRYGGMLEGFRDALVGDAKSEEHNRQLAGGPRGNLTCIPTGNRQGAALSGEYDLRTHLGYLPRQQKRKLAQVDTGCSLPCKAVRGVVDDHFAPSLERQLTHRLGHVRNITHVVLIRAR